MITYITVWYHSCTGTQMYGRNWYCSSNTQNSNHVDYYYISFDGFIVSVLLITIEHIYCWYWNISLIQQYWHLTSDGQNRDQQQHLKVKTLKNY